MKTPLHSIKIKTGMKEGAEGGKLKENNFAHTHAHRTQTYWPSQANNKLI